MDALQTGLPGWLPRQGENIGHDPARILVMFTPSGMKRFFEGQALPIGPLDAAAHRAIAHSAWIEILGPPMAVTPHIPLTRPRAWEPGP